MQPLQRDPINNLRQALPRIAPHQWSPLLHNWRILELDLTRDYKLKPPRRCGPLTGKYQAPDYFLADFYRANPLRKAMTANVFFLFHKMLHQVAEPWHPVQEQTKAALGGPFTVEILRDTHPH